MKRFLQKLNKKRKLLIFSALFIIIALSLAVYLQKTFLVPQEIVRTKVAIVIDDWGYNLHYIDLLRQIDIPLTISILPNLRYSTKIAEIAKDLGQEAILHLPLEPGTEGRDIGLEKDTLTSKMSEDEIISNFERAFSTVPFACGVSNHMGSLATTDKPLMSVVFSQLKKKKLFFLDNLVTNKSICRQLARRMKVKFASRDFFLDNEDDEDYIKEQFRKLKEFAVASGEAVGIGHAKYKTLKVLKEEIPLMQAEGIKFVFVSTLAE